MLKEENIESQEYWLIQEESVLYSFFGKHFGYENKKFSTELIDFLDVKCSIQTGV